MLRIYIYHSSKRGDIEIALTQQNPIFWGVSLLCQRKNTTQGGTHLYSREAIVKPFGFYNKSFEASDVENRCYSH
jgi:hypothetical protein